MQKREGIMRKLFLLEDDLSLISGLTFAFKKQGFALDTARTHGRRHHLGLRQRIYVRADQP